MKLEEIGKGNLISGIEQSGPLRIIAVEDAGVGSSFAFLYATFISNFFPRACANFSNVDSFISSA